MDLNYKPKPLISIEFPGTVSSVSNMEKTLGGQENMFKAFENTTKRLELKFRPDDPFCKAAHGDRFTSTNLVLKVIKRTKKKTDAGAAASSTADVQYSVEFLGVANTTYKFKTLADFQVLPISFDKNRGEYKSLLPSIIPTNLHPASWLSEEVDLFVPPLLFSRFDLPQTAYAESHNKHQDLHRNLPPNIIGRGRKRRTGYAIFCTFENSEISEKPKPEALKQLNSYPLDIEVSHKIRALFEQRPIWARNYLLLHIKCDKQRMKYSLPCVGYYFCNGPWRALWVRFGYDPRKDPASKIYQTMDIRIHPSIPINEKRLRTRSSYFAVPSKSSMNHQRGAVINPNDLLPPSEKTSTDAGDWETRRLACEYKSGELPSARQCFYQLCDIHLESVQKLVHQNDGQEKSCIVVDGWLVPGTLEKIRELIIADVIKTSKELRGAVECEIQED